MTPHSVQTAEQIIRPTGLVDPEVEVRPVEGQVDDLMGEIRARTEKGERVLVTTLTKKMSDEIEYFHKNPFLRPPFLKNGGRAVITANVF